MKCIAMIPARYAATRFPAKLMQDLNGKTVITRTYQATVATQLFEEVYVVTDSDIIREEIEANGGKCIMSKKAHESGSDRIAEAVADIDCDIVVNVQGDEPFTEKDSLEKVLEVFKDDNDHKIDLASLMVEILDPEEIPDPNIVKVLVDKDNFAIYFSRSPVPYAREKLDETKYYKHRGIYAFRRQAILDFTVLPMRILEATEKIECIRYLEYGRSIKMIETTVQGVEIDTPEQLQKARELWV